MIDRKVVYCIEKWVRLETYHPYCPPFRIMRLPAIRLGKSVVCFPVFDDAWKVNPSLEWFSGETRFIIKRIELTTGNIHRLLINKKIVNGKV